MPLPVGEDGKAISFPKEHRFEEEYSIQYPSYVNREYVWDPDQTDRILAQVDGAHHYTFIPTDESWTPVGVVEGGASVSSPLAGCVLSQFSFDPMGTLLNREDLSTSASLHRVDIGHQGLFFEPYEDEMMQSGTEDRLFPNRPGLYFNRARWYDAELGRFTTSDPNQTGVPQQYDIAWHGFEPMLMTPSLDLLTTYADGPSLYASRGHNPMRNKDPPGEFFSLAGFGTGTTVAAELQGDWSQEVADVGMSLMDSLYYGLADAADSQWMMLELAGDWGAPDDLFGPDMTAGGGATLEIGRRVGANPTYIGNGLSDLFVPLFMGTERDHLVPQFPEAHTTLITSCLCSWRTTAALEAEAVMRT